MQSTFVSSLATDVAFVAFVLHVTLMLNYNKIFARVKSLALGSVGIEQPP